MDVDRPFRNSSLHLRFILLNFKKKQKSKKKTIKVLDLARRSCNVKGEDECNKNKVPSVNYLPKSCKRKFDRCTLWSDKVSSTRKRDLSIANKSVCRTLSDT